MFLDSITKKLNISMPDGILKVQNVADYIKDMDKEKEDWDYDRDIICFVPPFERTWFEAKNVGFYTVLKKLIDGYEVALSMFIKDKSDEEYKFIKSKLDVSGFDPIPCNEDILLLDDSQKNELEKSLKEKRKYINDFMSTQVEDAVVGAMGEYVFTLDSEGRYLSHVFKLNKLFEDATEEDRNQLEMYISGGAVPLIILTLNFLHCKNVTMNETQIDKKLRKARAKRNKLPISRFYTLQIQPIKKALKNEGGAEESGIRQALHICRGHFKTFDEKGLFGKYRGTFYWPSQVRGTTESGEIKKDYEVTLPRK